MKNSEIIRMVRIWQNAEIVHPLTCGKNSDHSILKAVEEDGTVVLKCPSCDYIQTHIPNFVIRYGQAYIKNIERMLKS